MAQDPLHCCLSTHFLEDCPVYKALSYTWGDASIIKPLICNGKIMPITVNLWAALCRIRDETESQILWIDSICIDQESIEERTHQVRLMKDIYKMASEVVVWLGEETDDTALGLSLARNVASAANQWEKAGALMAEDLVKAGLPDWEAPDWKALEKIYWRTWFCRVWVIQEITMAKEAVVRCGAQCIPWWTLTSAACFIIDRNIASLAGIDPRRVKTMLIYRWRLQNGNGMRLPELLYMGRESYCTDPRDKIYALLGLAADAGDLSVNLDYSRDVKQVYQEVTSSFIFQYKSLDVLSMVQDYAWAVTTGLPSWTPDWAVLPRSIPFLRPETTSKFAASRTSEPPLHISEDQTTLFATGKVVDTIRSIGTANVPARLISTGRYASKFNDALNQVDIVQMRHWEVMARKLKSYPTGESPQEVYWRTIIADADMDVENVPGGYNRIFYAWRRYWGTVVDEKFVDMIHDDGTGDRVYSATYNNARNLACNYRRFIVTKKGYIGLAPFSSRPGDHICILLGGRTPYVIRSSRKRQFRFIGESYVHGFMNGEAMEGPEEALQELAIR